MRSASGTVRVAPCSLTADRTLTAFAFLLSMSSAIKDCNKMNDSGTLLRIPMAISGISGSNEVITRAISNRWMLREE